MADLKMTSVYAMTKITEAGLIAERSAIVSRVISDSACLTPAESKYLSAYRAGERQIEIAKRMKVSRAAVHNSIHRAQDKIAQVVARRVR